MSEHETTGKVGGPEHVEFWAAIHHFGDVRSPCGNPAQEKAVARVEMAAAAWSHPAYARRPLAAPGGDLAKRLGELLNEVAAESTQHHPLEVRKYAKPQSHQQAYTWGYNAALEALITRIGELLRAQPPAPVPTVRSSDPPAHQRPLYRHPRRPDRAQHHPSPLPCRRPDGPHLPVLDHPRRMRPPVLGTGVLTL